jgi:hypothetical protein
MTVRVAEVSELPMSSCVPGIKLGYKSMCRSVFCSPQAILNVGLLFSAKIRLKNKHQDARVEAPRKKHINQNPCFWWQHAHLNWHDFEKHDPFKTFSYRCNKFWVDSDCSVYVLVVIPKAEGTNLPKIGYTSTTVDDLCRIISCCRGCMANMTNPLSLFAPWKREFTVFGL